MNQATIRYKCLKGFNTKTALKFWKALSFNQFLLDHSWCNFDKQILKTLDLKARNTISYSNSAVQWQTGRQNHHSSLQENIILLPFLLKCHLKTHYTISPLSLVAFIMHSNFQALTFLMKPILKFYVPEIQSSLVDVWISFQACIQIKQLVLVCIVIYFTTWNKRRFSIGKTFQLLPANCLHNITDDKRDFGIMSIFITDIM